MSVIEVTENGNENSNNSNTKSNVQQEEEEEEEESQKSTSSSEDVLSKLGNKPRTVHHDRGRSTVDKLEIDLSKELTAPFDPTVNNSLESSPSSKIYTEAWKALRSAEIFYHKRPIGTIAALENPASVDKTVSKLNYDQVFMRDFVPSALAYLMNGEFDIVKNFLEMTLRLQALEKKVDMFKLGDGVMPASFKVIHDSDNKETIEADFGGSAIARVAPVDSGFWWIILLRAYFKASGDSSLHKSDKCQKGIRLILNLCLSEGFDTFPTLLCADGCCMIDRRMGVYGYPIEIQALFYMALNCASELLISKKEVNRESLYEENWETLYRLDGRMLALSYHMREYFWLDLEKLNTIYRYKTEEYSEIAVNKFNVIPDSLPDWIFDFMPCSGGYFIGNVSPARMDFRWFCLGNCMAILSSLATPAQSAAILDLIESRWGELVGEMPLKVCYPALENHEWRIETGCDPKNTRWSYHNGGSWPVLLWLLTAACVKTGRLKMASRAVDLAESRLMKDDWPEYYDGKKGRFVGKQARKYQTWSIAGYLVSKLLLKDHSCLGMVSIEEHRPKKPAMRKSKSSPWLRYPDYVIKRKQEM